MNDTFLQILNFGKAIGEVLGEKAQVALTETMSELEKIKAEQSQNVRQLINEVEEKVNQKSSSSQPSQIVISGPEKDTQTILDELRAEIASLRSELKNYRQISQ
jgi:malonyl CoA-acyl carrier protein transacylase